MGLGTSLVIGVSHEGPLRERVVDVLSSQWPLSARQVYDKLSEGKKEFSYQGVHKALLVLHEEGIVLKNTEGYFLSREWLQKLTQDLEKVVSAYEAANFSTFSDQKVRLSSDFTTILFFKSLLVNRQMTMSRNEFRIYGNRFFMSPAGIFMELFAHSKRKKDDAIYLACKKISEEWHGNLRKKKIAKSDLDDAIKFKVEAMVFAGWGEPVFEYVDMEKKEARASMQFSPWAKEYVERFGKSEEPICDATRGFLGGLFTMAYNDDTVQCEETSCIASGQKKCVFEIMRKEEILK